MESVRFFGSNALKTKKIPKFTVDYCMQSRPNQWDGAEKEGLLSTQCTPPVAALSHLFSEKSSQNLLK
jgi:hypothetical protein